MPAMNRVEPRVEPELHAVPTTAGDESAAPPPLAAEPAVTLPPGEMAALYQRLRTAHPVDAGLVVQVIGVHPGVGATSVVCGIGSAVATRGDQRVLLCDATETQTMLERTRAVVRRRLPKLAAYNGFENSVGLVACALDSERAQPAMIANVVEYAAALTELRRTFDLILIDSPAANSSDLGPALSRHVDCVVVVVEAERTRAPMVAAALRRIEAGGGRVAGVVLNKRIQHIPESVYRWL
jgi:Mrp family chromosome partitioning ATPase